MISLPMKEWPVTMYKPIRKMLTL